MNRHEIKTIEDILKCVNSQNIGFFIKDFSDFLAFMVAAKETLDPETVNIEETMKASAGFTWIDDGKNEKKISITVK